MITLRDVLGIVAVVILLMNLVGIFLMGLDKSYARHDHYRISENMLMTIALLGGSIGILFGMLKFRHKTKKPKFAYGVPLILLIQIALLIVYGYPIFTK